MYRVLQTSTTVGYGDMNVSNNNERFFSILLMIFGVGFYSYTIGNLSSILSTMDSKQQKLNVINNRYNIPKTYFSQKSWH